MSYSFPLIMSKHFEEGNYCLLLITFKEDKNPFSNVLTIGDKARSFSKVLKVTILLVSEKWQPKCTSLETNIKKSMSLNCSLRI